MTFVQDYCWASGFNVADGSLVVISDDLAPYVTPYLGTVVMTPRSGMIDTFPIRSITLDGQQRGDGMVFSSLSWAALPLAAYTYIYNTYFSSGSVVSVPMTVVLAQYPASTVFSKYNAWMTLPEPFKDYTYDSANVLNLRITLSDLILLS